MTRKHFEALAQALGVASAKCVTSEERRGVAMATDAVVDVCAAANARFDGARFVSHLYVTEARERGRWRAGEGGSDAQLDGHRTGTGCRKASA
jgi:hypothetical protein